MDSKVPDENLVVEDIVAAVVFFIGRGSFCKDNDLSATMTLKPSGVVKRVQAQTS